MGSPQADARSTLVPKHAETARAGFHDRGDDVSTGVSKARAWAATTIRVGPRPEPIGGPALAVPHRTGAHSIGRSDGRAGGTTRPIKARSASPAVGTSRPVLTVRRTGRPTPRSNYELFNCNNLNIRYWSWNYRGCWHQTCPPMDPR
ncbi:hypothetical protein V6N13_022244 [Hibiscus sabdariffa]